MGGKSKGVPETSYERANAEVALKKYQDYMDKGRPFERKFIEQITEDTAIPEKRIAGQVNSDLMQQTKPVLPSGVDPSSGGAMVVDPSMGKTGAKAQVDAGQAVRDRRVAGIQAAIDIGRGNASSAQLGYSNLANDSVNKAIGSAGSKMEEKNAYANAAGSAAGVGAAIYTNQEK